MTEKPRLATDYKSQDVELVRSIVKEGVAILEAAFKDLDASGPRDVAIFLSLPRDDDLRQDVSALVLDFLEQVRQQEDRGD